MTFLNKILIFENRQTEIECSKCSGTGKIVKNQKTTLITIIFTLIVIITLIFSLAYVVEGNNLFINVPLLVISFAVLVTIMVEFKEQTLFG